MRILKIIYILTLPFYFFLSACTPAGGSVAKEGMDFTGGNTAFQIRGELSGCEVDSIFLYQINGLELAKLYGEPLTNSGEKYSFSIQGNIPRMGTYFLGKAPNNIIPIILGEEDQVSLSGNCMNLRASVRLDDSQINVHYRQIQPSFYKVQAQIQQTLSSSGDLDISSDITALVKKQRFLADSFRAVSPFLGKVADLYIYEPFNPGNDPEGYGDPMKHYIATFLSHVDLADPSYERVAELIDQLEGYLRVLYSGGISESEAEQYLNTFLNRIPAESLTYKNVLAIVLSTLGEVNALAFVSYAEEYLKKYEVKPSTENQILQQSAAIAATAEARREAEKFFGIGGTPPDIDLPTPSGESLSLYSLRGKVVLLDFWAAWCKPCRIETPNVVRAYDKYKDNGFTVYSVSLDADRNAWLKAIEQDNMTWYHVSDLKHFRSEAAQKYQINAIPATFLLDKNGVIVAKNLRGIQLDNKLAEIFDK